MTGGPASRPPLLVIVPTRGRPRNAARLLNAFAATTTGAAQLLFAVDDDDPALAAYLELIPEPMVTVGRRLGLCGTTNELAVAHADDYPYLGSIGDDHLPRTVAWDRAVVDTLRSIRHGIVYGDDLFQHDNLPTAVFLASSIVTALGYMAPPALHHLFIDNAWRDLGQRLGTLRYLPHVIIEHLHPEAGTADWDDTYHAGSNDAVYQHDEAAYTRWVADELDQAVRTIRAAR